MPILNKHNFLLYCIMENTHEQQQQIASPEINKDINLEQALAQKLPDQNEQSLFLTIIQQESISQVFSPNEIQAYIQGQDIQ